MYYYAFLFHLGMFAMDRQYQKTKSKSPSPPENDKRKDKGGTADDCSSDEDVIESDEECQRVLESGGRDRCAYFFWQGYTCCTIHVVHVLLLYI